MSQSNVTAEQGAKCLRILQDAASPIVAADLARKLGLGGSRESRRRHVRAIVEHLRSKGSMIVATQQQGYWLTEDEQLWKDYLETRQIDAKRILGEVHRRKKEVNQPKGQGFLFDTRVRVGCAMMRVN